jgi:hypothetical protein
MNNEGQVGKFSIKLNWLSTESSGVLTWKMDYPSCYINGEQT